MTLGSELSDQLKAGYGKASEVQSGKYTMQEKIAQLVTKRENDAAAVDDSDDHTLQQYAASVDEHNTRTGAVGVSTLYTVRSRIVFDVLCDLLSRLKQARIAMMKTKSRPFNKRMYYSFVGRLLQPLFSGCVMLLLPHILHQSGETGSSDDDALVWYMRLLPSQERGSAPPSKRLNNSTPASLCFLTTSELWMEVCSKKLWSWPISHSRC